jgi:ketosteroid isomerase-like protein
MTHAPEDCQNPHAEVVRAAIAGLSAKDPEAVLACLAEDGVVVLPFEHAVPDLDPRRLEKFLVGLFATYEVFDLRLTHLYELVDPDTLIARYEGACVSTEGVPYDNSYLAVFEFAGGKISNWREYDDPTVSASSMAAHAAALAARSEAGS